MARNDVSEFFQGLTIASVIIVGSYGVLRAANAHNSHRNSRQPTPGYIRAEKRMRLEADAHNIWYGKHDGDKALALLQEARQHGGDTDYIQGLTADILDAQGKPSEAYAYYRKLMYNRLAMTEKSSSRILRYGELSEQFHQPEEARAAYNEALARSGTKMRMPEYIPLSPLQAKNVGELHTLAQLVLGANSRKISLLKTVVGAHPEMAVAHLYMGVTILTDIHGGMNGAAEQSRAKAELEKAAALGTGETRAIAEAQIQKIDDEAKSRQLLAKIQIIAARQRSPRLNSGVASLAQ